MTRSRYAGTAAAIYGFFVVYGMAVIVMSQTSAHLQAQWGATEGEVLVAISGVGLGKVAGPVFAGPLSDRFGRRAVVLTSLVLYLAFAVGLLTSRSWQLGLALAVVFGLANAIGDTGNYPTLIESFPAFAGSANVAAKAAIAVGQLVLPLAVTAVAAHALPWQTSVVGLVVVLGALLVVQLRAVYPPRPPRVDPGSVAPRPPDAPRLRTEGSLLVGYAFCATAMFWLAQNSLPRIGAQLAGMPDAAARGLVSWYSTGSFAGVLVTAALVARRLRPTAVLAGYPVAAAVAYLLLATSHLPWVFVLAALVIGFFAGGGLFQLAVVVLAGLFPTRKGVATSLIGLASGASAFVMPYVSGLLVGDGSHAATAYRWITVLGLVVAVLAAGLGTVVRARHARLAPPVPVAPAEPVPSGS